MLNKQGLGKIDWCDYSWNPVSGCKHGCSYCYMQRLVERFHYDFEPKFHPERLNEIAKLTTPSKIFVSSSGDLFGEWVSDDWIDSVIKVIRQAPQHTFLFLTKNPKRYNRYQYEHMKEDYPSNIWLGTTIDGTAKTSDNLWHLYDSGYKYKIDKNSKPIGNVPNNKRFISFEPLLTDVFQTIIDKQQEWMLENIQWFIIGADSNRGATKAPIDWADKLIEFAKSKEWISVWVKDNYGYPEKIKEWPK